MSALIIKPLGVVFAILGVCGIVLYSPPTTVVHVTTDCKTSEKKLNTMEYPSLNQGFLKRWDRNGKEILFTRFIDVICVGGTDLNDNGLSEIVALRNCTDNKACHSVTCHKGSCKYSTPTCVLTPALNGRVFLVVGRTPKKRDYYKILLNNIEESSVLKKGRPIINSEVTLPDYNFDKNGTSTWKHKTTSVGNTSVMPYIEVTEQDYKYMNLGCVDPIHKLVFFRMPKVQSSNILRLYDRLLGHTDVIHDTKGKILMHSVDVENDPRRPRLSFKYLSRKVVNSIMNDPSFKKIVFFRDPMERILSCYLDKFRRTHYSNFFNQTTGTTTFEELISYLQKSGPPPYGVGPGVNYHYQAQVLVGNLYKFLPQFDFIGWGDNSHTKLMLERYGLWNKFGAKTWKNGFMKAGDDHPTGSKDHFSYYFNSTKIEDDAKNAYAIDYQFFNYIGLEKGGPPVTGKGVVPHKSICFKNITGCAPGKPIVT